MRTDLTRVATLLLALCVLHTESVRASAVQADHLRIELLSESSALVPGSTHWLGVYLRHAPHWHTYWINPGDSGLPTRLDWQLPDGYAAGAIEWPAPSRFEVGGLYNFGYANDILLPVALQVPSSAAPDTSANLSVTAKWLICEEECIPGQADLQLQLPVAHESVPTASAALFAQARAATPVATDWSGSARLDQGRFDIRLSGAGLPPVDTLDVFAVQRRLLDNAPATLRRERDGLRILVDRNDYFVSTPPELELVLTSTMTNGAAAAWQVRVPFSADGSADVRPDVAIPKP